MRSKFVEEDDKLEVSTHKSKIDAAATHNNIGAKEYKIEPELKSK